MDNQEMNGMNIPFKAETVQLLNILIHSLYNDREVFLRELISNASDALTRLSFEMLTNRDVVDPEAELKIHITTNSEEKLLIISDTGIGMNEAELIENLGTIAQSGARSFIQAVQDKTNHLSDIIGQFGVGFYSSFMVADWIRVTSRSYRQEDQAASWYSDGSGTFNIEPAQSDHRGTTITIKLKEDSAEFLEEMRIREIIRKHSDFIPFPIYLNNSEEKVNQQMALWRQSTQDINDQQIIDFYRQFTLDFEEPLTHIHMAVDAPLQMYALLFIPTNPERNIFSPRKQDGLKLYARKILIQEYTQDLLPKSLRFIQGVVDSEDLPLNVSRESVQSTKLMAQLKKLVTNKVIETLSRLANENPDAYQRFWEAYSTFVKEGVATDEDYYQKLMPLLRFHSLKNPSKWISLDDYLENKPSDQQKIYYILGEEDQSIIHSPHLEAYKQKNLDVLLFTDPVDPFVLMHTRQYKDVELVNAATEKLDIEPTESSEDSESESDTKDKINSVIDRLKTVIGDKVTDVRTTYQLVESPARLIDAEGALNPELQRVYRIMNKEVESPAKILEINPRHPIILKLAELPESNELGELIANQLYENALLIEGLHPDPAGMIERIQKLMQSALQ